jgi:hypothetical protein
MTKEEEFDFVKAAFDKGSFVFICRDKHLQRNRFLVTVDKVSIPIWITDELWFSRMLPHA